MVKVMENSIVDLDVVPGKNQQQLQAQAQQQAQAMGGQAGYDFPPVLPLTRVGRLKADSRLSSEQAQEAMKNLPPEQQEQAKGMMANAQAGAGALAGTAGGAVKGVVDTAGNTVCPPWSNLHKVASYAATSLNTSSSGEEANRHRSALSVAA